MHTKIHIKMYAIIYAIIYAIMGVYMYAILHLFLVASDSHSQLAPPALLANANHSHLERKVNSVDLSGMGQ
jgi:hypothetical protein